MMNAHGVDRPSITRTYDYFLGGKDNFACDRDLAARLLAVAPHTPANLRAGRIFRREIVHHLAAKCGIRQFLDIGVGMPMPNENLHQITQRIDPRTRVVYVDNDPVVLSYGRALLADKPGTAVVEGDLREPEELLADPTIGRLIDFDQPVAVLMHSVLEFISAEHRPQRILAHVRRTIAPGSYLSISHLVSHPQTRQSATIYRKVTAEPMVVRSRQEIRRFFKDLSLVPPGIAPVTCWYKCPQPTGNVWLLGALGFKPENSRRTQARPRLLDRPAAKLRQ